MSRNTVAQFLLGFFALPVCALFGLMEAVLFHAGNTVRTITVLVVAAIPLIGTIRSRQRVLLTGLVCGALASFAAYMFLHAS